MNLQVELQHADKRKNIPIFDERLGFGKVFTDHMFLMEYSDDHWHSARIESLANFALPPSTIVLHYGQGIFEGMKAYRDEEKIYFFRPEENMKRMNRSARRMVMPPIDEEFVLESIKKLVVLEKDWIPTEPGYSLYIRPTMIATDEFLGIRPSQSYLFFVIVGPVGAYYAEGFNPVDIYVSEQYVRAAKGGVGDVKTMGNYAASLLAQKDAHEHGCSQVLWLDAVERKYIEEVGAMNVFILFDDELVTPALTGTILPGVVRDSVLQITRSWGMNVVERPVSIDEVIDGIRSGRVKEVFGTGTAAIVSSIGKLLYQGKDYVVNGGEAGDLSCRLFDYLTSLQIGKEKDLLDFVRVLTWQDQLKMALDEKRK